MKRLVLAILTLFALGSLYPVTSQASLLYRDELISFRHLRAAAGNNGVVDSTDATHTGAITDTTGNFPRTARRLAFAPPGINGAPTDSIMTVGLNLVLASTSTAAAAGDSIYVTLQGRFGNGTWISAPQVCLLELGNGAGLTFYRGYSAATSGTITAAAATTVQLGVCNEYRWIIQTSAATTGRLQARVSYWKEE